MNTHLNTENIEFGTDLIIENITNLQKNAGVRIQEHLDYIKSLVSTSTYESNTTKFMIHNHITAIEDILLSGY